MLKASGWVSGAQFALLGNCQYKGLRDVQSRVRGCQYIVLVAPVHCTCGASTTLGGGASWCRSVLESTSDLPDLLIQLFLSEAGDLLTSTDGDHQINIAPMFWFNDVTAGNKCVNVNYFTDKEMRD